MGDIVVGNSIARVTQEINVCFQRLISDVLASYPQAQTYSFIVFQLFPDVNAEFFVSVLRTGEGGRQHRILSNFPKKPA